ncbi:DUF2089 domain-containing protein [Meiothermus sp.]|uniref:DUF2089 domain-containing protein n=1 Tax=Meiothermus sp. TaxID=1955249 RepID=UPI0021DBD160|nr:DUF2089 domain-containing protein [Meiothermus sp.]GIW24175.1 MAG: hypothetical protein KatS3mg069_0442 [Meiothermus sp.]
MNVFPMPTECPVQGCNGRLHVTGLVCSACRTEVKGEFQPNEFALLPPEHLEFLRLYIKVRGNLKEVERILGLSYPTVRARFESLLRVLGYEEEVDQSPSTEEKEAILSALEKGQLSAAEAAERLRALKKR